VSASDIQEVVKFVTALKSPIEQYPMNVPPCIGSEYPE